ncbi:hypothetical protein JF540_09415 [Salipiger thiooxidans]|uniref:hypothetical protein n=1 Tax=Salipiger thiooxidans TaxID=282683 RepID=UPI001A8C61FD|nr:hypothetical protein [Salipiger thiooxidans]MBN8186907.1 hypothetical protein [Salipiger thiooxidans]
MSRSRLVTLHGVSGAAALGLVACFWSLALWCELGAPAATVVVLRQVILYALPLRVLALATAGASGARLAGRVPGLAARAKLRRMRLAAVNGLLVLIPAAVLLGLRARAGDLSGPFATVQAVEFCAGAVNIVLLGRNLAAGLAMRARASHRA